jgi:hypothetical protein
MSEVRSSVVTPPVRSSIPSLLHVSLVLLDAGINHTQSNLLPVPHSRHVPLRTPSPIMVTRFRSGLDSMQRTKLENQSGKSFDILSQHLLDRSALVGGAGPMANPNLGI